MRKSPQEIYSTYTRRFFIPAKPSEIKTFLCSMNIDRYNESKTQMDKKLNFVPYGYIAYLLKAYGYHISSIIPFNGENREDILRNAIPIDKIPINNNYINGYVRGKDKDFDQNIIYSAVTIYNTSSKKFSIVLPDDLKYKISNTPTKYVFINILQIITTDTDEQGRYNMTIFFDKIENRSEVLLDTTFYDNELYKKIIKELFNLLMLDLKNATFPPRYLTEITDKKISDLILIHHKILNPKYTFDQLMVNINQLIVNKISGTTKNVVDIFYSYYNKILALSKNPFGDLKLLKIYF
jgi:hypothetical protein